MARGAASGPRGRVTLRELRKRLQQGWPAGLTLLTGDDLYHLDQAQRELLDALVPEETRRFALTVIGGEGRTSVAEVVSQARSVGMFAPRRVVLVRDPTALEGEPAALEAFAAEPPPNAYLIVRAVQLDRRRKLHQALATLGTTLSFGRPASGAEAEGELREIATSKGLTLGPAAVRALAEVCGGDLTRADSELEKIRLWLGAEGAAAGAIDSLPPTVVGAGLLSGWEVADAVLARDTGAALAALRRFVDSGEEPLRLLGGIAFRARGMLRAKALIEQEHEVPRRAIGEAGLWGQETSVMLRGLERYTLAELLAFPAQLLGADREMKSRLLADDVVLETMVERLIAQRGAVSP